MHGSLRNAPSLQFAKSASTHSIKYPIGNVNNTVVITIKAASKSGTDRVEKGVARQAGNNHPTSIPTGVFKTSDGYINIATTGGRINLKACSSASVDAFV